jgi:hypothetical protein
LQQSSSWVLHSYEKLISPQGRVDVIVQHTESELTFKHSVKRSHGTGQNAPLSVISNVTGVNANAGEIRHRKQQGQLPLKSLAEINDDFVPARREGGSAWNLYRPNNVFEGVADWRKLADASWPVNQANRAFARSKQSLQSEFH